MSLLVASLTSLSRNRETAALQSRGRRAVSINRLNLHTVTHMRLVAVVGNDTVSYQHDVAEVCALYRLPSRVTKRVRREGNAIGIVCPSVRLFPFLFKSNYL